MMIDDDDNDVCTRISAGGEGWGLSSLKLSCELFLIMLVVGCPSGVIQGVLSLHNYFVLMLVVVCPSGVIQGVLSSHNNNNNYYYYFCYVTRTLLAET